MTIGKGAGPDGLNLSVIPFRDRTDFDASRMRPDSPVWLVKDIFTTHNGSWEVDASAQFGIDQWARDAYLFPPDNPRYNTDGGADHNIQVCVQAIDGARLAGAGCVFTSDGASNLQPPSPSVVLRNTEPHGWTNIPIFGGGATSYPPAPGPWCASKLSDLAAADIVCGMGMPWNWHVSTFIVYQATRWGLLQPTYATLEDALHGEAQAHQVMQLNPGAALQKRIFADGFVPNSQEFDLAFGGVDYVAQRAEHLGTGVCRAYYCVRGVWDVVLFTAWMP